MVLENRVTMRGSVAPDVVQWVCPEGSGKGDHSEVQRYVLLDVKIDNRQARLR